MTTILNYGSVATDRQGEIIKGLGAVRPSEQKDVDDIAEAVARK